MSEEFELISVPKELLENLVRRILAEYISLSTPEPEQDEEPIGYVYSEYGNPRKSIALNDDSIPNGTPVFLRPAPRKPFVRLSEEEMRDVYAAWMLDVRTDMFAFARAIEDALEEKNK